MWNWLYPQPTSYANAVLGARRPSLKGKRLRDQIVQDIFGYRRHPDAQALFVAVYDPTPAVDNPRGFEDDLNDEGPAFPVRVTVTVTGG